MIERWSPGRWSLVHAGVCLGTILVLWVAPGWVSLLIMVAVATVSFAVLAAFCGAAILGPANLATSSRMLISAGGVTVSALGAEVSWWSVAAVGAAELGDWADGYLARRFGYSSDGARLDEEADAFLILCLSGLLVASGQVPAWILAAGGLRYLYVLATTRLPHPPLPGWFGWQAKSICVASALLLLVAAAAPLLPVAKIIAAGSALTALTYSFLLTVWLRISITTLPDAADRR